MIKQNAKTLHIKEQYINDLVTGLTLIFRVTPDGEARLHILGDSLMFGNRDLQFDKDGILVGTGTGIRNHCKMG